MLSRKWFPRLNRADCEALMAAHRNCVAISAMLAKTQWNGAPGCLELVGQVDLVIARLYNRAEPSFMATAGAAAASSPVDGEAEIPGVTAEESSSAPAPELEEK